MKFTFPRTEKNEAENRIFDLRKIHSSASDMGESDNPVFFQLWPYHGRPREHSVCQVSRAIGERNIGR